jgi:diguanylate cyclase (GGDEF)-like protein
VGDEALRKVASRLDSCLRDADTSARLGGDEFAVLLEGVTQLTDIELVAERLLAALSAPMRLRGVVHDFSASIGIALGAGARTVDELIDAADHAMYEAKARGKNQIAIAGPRAWRPSPHEGERRDSASRL